MNYTELNAWLNQKINVQKKQAIIVTLNGKYDMQEDVLKKRINEFVDTTGTDAIIIEEIIE